MPFSYSRSKHEALGSLKHRLIATKLTTLTTTSSNVTKSMTPSATYVISTLSMRVDKIINGCAPRCAWWRKETCDNVKYGYKFKYNRTPKRHRIAQRRMRLRVLMVLSLSISIYLFVVAIYTRSSNNYLLAPRCCFRIVVRRTLCPVDVLLPYI